MKEQRSRPVHPTQAIARSLGFSSQRLLLAYMPFAVVRGALALMLMIEPVTRFLLEMLRVEPTVVGTMSSAWRWRFRSSCWG